MFYLILKAIHIIFMVSYFAGIFYLVRIFVYYKDTDNFEEPRKHILREQYVFMLRKLWNIITVPAFCIMLLSGLCMIFYYFPAFPLLSTNPFSWFYIKIFFLCGLFAYHYWCWKKVLQIRDLKGEDLPTDNLKLRQANEIATFILFLVVFTVILKSAVFDYGLQLIIGFFVLVFIIMLTVKLVNRKKHQWKPFWKKNSGVILGITPPGLCLLRSAFRVHFSFSFLKMIPISLISEWLHCKAISA